MQRNLRTRLCLISKSNHHEDYQLARRLLPLHTCAAMMSTMTTASPAATRGKFLMYKVPSSPWQLRYEPACSEPVSIFLLVLVLYEDDNAKG